MTSLENWLIIQHTVIPCWHCYSVFWQRHSYDGSRDSRTILVSLMDHWVPFFLVSDRMKTLWAVVVDVTRLLWMSSLQATSPLLSVSIKGTLSLWKTDKHWFHVPTVHKLPIVHTQVQLLLRFICLWNPLSFSISSSFFLSPRVNFPTVCSSSVFYNTRVAKWKYNGNNDLHDSTR